MYLKQNDYHQFARVDQLQLNSSLPQTAKSREMYLQALLNWQVLSSLHLPLKISPIRGKVPLVFSYQRQVSEANAQ